MMDLNKVKFGKVEKVGRIDFKSRDISKLSCFDSISPPSIFVGSGLTYPNVNVGILSPVFDQENASFYEDYKGWANEGVSVRDVLNLRGGLLNSRFTSSVTDVRLNNKFSLIAQDIAISSNPVDVEIELKDKVRSGMGRDQVATPHGMKAQLKNAKVTNNVKVNKFVDRVMNDEVKSNEGMNILYKRGIDEYSIQKILSVGALGISKDKKMVPTRWSITATDDNLAKHVMKRVRTYPYLQDFELMFGEFLGNQYLILLFPQCLSFELFELYYPGSSWNSSTDFKASHDYEGFMGRTSYAKNCVGGYYATRLPIIEYLDKIKRQAGILAIRLETPSYWAALGVWVVRESVRKAILRGSMKFGDKEEFLNAVEKIGKIKYDFDMSEIYLRSWLLNEGSIQRRIDEYFEA